MSDQEIPEVDVVDERGHFIGRASWFQDWDERKREALAAIDAGEAPEPPAPRTRMGAVDRDS